MELPVRTMRFGVTFPMDKSLEAADGVIPNLAGIKFNSPGDMAGVDRGMRKTCLFAVICSRLRAGWNMENKMTRQ